MWQYVIAAIPVAAILVVAILILCGKEDIDSF